ncbi:MAG: alpha/beta fold hydrolase [Patescibacteria group bacterium]
MDGNQFDLRNASGQKIVGLLNLPGGLERPLPPIILVHGLKGFMRMPMLEMLANSLVKLGYAVYRFDGTDGIGESSGNIFDSTVTHYLGDLSVVLDYVSQQPDLNLEKLSVFGTSMGGLVATLAAGRDPRIKRLITHSAAFDWNILRQHPDIIDWREGEWIEFVSKSKGVRIKVGFDLFTDGIKYNAYKVLRQLPIPKLFMHSGQDEAIPVEFSKRAFREAAEPKKLVIIDSASHNITNSGLVEKLAYEISIFLNLV